MINSNLTKLVALLHLREISSLLTACLNVETAQKVMPFICLLYLLPLNGGCVLSSPYLFSVIVRRFIQSFVLGIVTSTGFFSLIPSVGFEGSLSRLRKQMSTLQRLICLIRLAAPSIPAFIYLLTLFTCLFIYLPRYGFGLISSPLPIATLPPLLFLSSSLAPISKISLQRRGR